MIDLTKLTPVPCRVEVVDDVGGGHYAKIASTGSRFIGSFWQQADAEFYVLARNAFDVMMRREWFASSYQTRDGKAIGWRLDKQCVYDLKGNIGVIGWDFEKLIDSRFFADPLTAIVEADKWYRENVEKASVNP